MWSMVVQPRLGTADREPDAGMVQTNSVRARATRTSAPCWYCVAWLAMAQVLVVCARRLRSVRSGYTPDRSGQVNYHLASRL